MSPTGHPRRDPGSFRDPTSAVYVTDDAAYRGLDAAQTAALSTALDGGFLRSAIRAGQVVGTDLLAAPPTGLADEAWSGWLRHEHIPVVTYPYEWSFAMLQAAARLTLDLLRQALAAGYVLKDATPYNVQFVGSRPVFIDVGSFEPYRDGDPWFGYRQFCQLFLYPLLFQAHAGVPFQPWLRGALEGITPEEALAVLGGRVRVHRGFLTHVWLHAKADRRMADTEVDVTDEVRRAGYGAPLIEAMARKLDGVIARLSWGPAASEWSDYSDRSHYSPAALRAKTAFVDAAVDDAGPALVWDIGANDGAFSRRAADRGARVLALDKDPLVVDRLWSELHRGADERILPLVFDLADPSPGLGWRGRERSPLEDRARPDLVLALAVVHHLAITHHVPLAELVDAFAALTPRLVVELPGEDDPMVRRLLRGKRDGLHDDYRLEHLEALFAERFQVLRREALPDGHRVILDLRSA